MGLSFWHILLIILIIAVLFVSPDKLAGFGSALGKSIRGFKKGLSEEEEPPKDQDKDINKK